MRNKKILQINTTVNYGSHGRIAEEIGTMAIQKGWDSYIAFGRYERPSKSNLIKIGDGFDIKLHGLQTRLFDRHGLGSKNATKDLVKKIQDIQPDIIHLHNIHGYYLNYEVLFAYLSSVDTPVVWTLHDCWAFTGHCPHFEFVGCQKWVTQCFNCPQYKMYPGSFFYDGSRSNYLNKKNAFNSVSNLTIVAVSDWLARLVRESFLGHHRLEMIHNGINTTTFMPVDPGDSISRFNLENQFVILGVASPWTEKKGLMEFLKLAETLGVNDTIVLVGLDAKTIKQLPENVVGIERTENITALISLYSTAHVFINPTFEDNFPSTNLEALACGTPVITYRTGGSIEAVDHNTGFVVNQGDIEGLIAAIEIIKRKGKEAFSDACRERVRQLFDANDRYSDYFNLYDSVLSNSHKKEL